MFQQYELLLKCVPNETDTDSCVLSNAAPLTKPSAKYKQIDTKCANILQLTKKALTEFDKYDHVHFHNFDEFTAIVNAFQKITEEISLLANECAFDSNNRMVLGKAAIDLLEVLKKSEVDFNLSIGKETKESAQNEFENIGPELENIIHSVLFSMQNIYKKYSLQTQPFYDNKEKSFESEKSDKTDDFKETNETNADLIEEGHLKLKINAELIADLEMLNIPKVLTKLSNILLTVRYSRDYNGKLVTAQKLIGILPILEQYSLLCKFYLIQSIGAHKVTSKMLAIMLTVFVELGAKGFCVPPDLMQDEDGDANEKEEKGSEGFGLEDGTGDKDVSDK